MKRLLALMLVLSMLIGAQPVSWADVTDGTVSNSILVSATDENMVLGGVGTVDVVVSNPEDFWLYNINVEMILSNGAAYDAPSDPLPVSVEAGEVGGAFKQAINWLDLTDLAPGQSFTLRVPVEVLEHYIVDGDHPEEGESTGFDSIGCIARASASTNPYGFDEIYAEDDFDVTVVPFKVSLSSPGKQLKGAGTTSGSADNFNTFAQSLTIENNAYFPSQVELEHFVPSGVEISNLSDSFESGGGTSTAGASGYYDLADGASFLMWQVSLEPGAVWRLGYDSAIFDKYTSGGVVNLGDRIADGTALPFKVDYRGETVQYGGTDEEETTTVPETTLTKNAIAKDLILSKSGTITSGSPLGYGSEIEYALTLKTAQYSTMTAIELTDGMGDGLDCIEGKYSGEDYLYAGPDGTSVTSYEHNSIPGNENFSWTIDTMPVESTATVKLSAEVLEDWTQGVLTGEPIVAGDNVTNLSSALSKAEGVHDAAETNISASKSINRPTIYKELLSINGSPASQVDGFYQVQVGDELRLRLTYDASAVNADQKNVDLFDFYPFETEFSTSSAVFHENNSTIGSAIIPSYDPDGETYSFDASSIWGSAREYAFFGYGGNQKLFRVGFPEIPRNTVLAVEYVLVVKDTIDVVNGKENQSMAKTSFENSSKVISSQREQLGFLYEAPELSISKSIVTSEAPLTTASSLDGLVSGDTVKFMLEVNNDGDAPAYGVVVKDILDGELENISVISPESGVSVSGNVLTATIPTIAAGGTASVVYTADVIAGIGAKREFENNASLDTYKKVLAGPDYSDQAATVSAAMEADAPELAKTVHDTEHSPVRVGDWLVYEIDLSVPMGATLYNAKLTENIPAGQSIIGAYDSFDAATDAPGANLAYTTSGTSAVFDLGDHSDAAKTIYVKVGIDSAVGVSSTQTNNVGVAWDDKDLGGESHSITTTTDVSIEKPVLVSSWNDSSFNLVRGDTKSLVYTIENTGENSAYGFVPQISIPVGLTPSNWTVSPSAGPVLTGGYNVYTFPEKDSLPADGIHSIGFDIEVDDIRAAGERLSIIGETGDYHTTPAKVVAIDTVSATASLNIPVLNIAKTVLETSNGTSKTEIRPGDTVTYDMVVTVYDGTSAYDLEIRDRLPGDFELVSFQKGADSYLAGSYNLLGDFTADSGDETIEFTLVARATTDGAYGGVLDYRARNRSDIRWDLSGTTDENKIDGSNRDIRVKQPNLEITDFSSTDNTFNTEGQAIDFTATIKNTGSSEAHDAVVSVEIPSGMSVSDVGPAGMVTGDIAGGHTITWNFDELAAGAEQDFSYTITEDGDLTGTPSNGDVVLEIEEYFSTDDAGAKQYGPESQTIVLNQPPYALDFSITTDEDTSATGIGVPVDIDTAEEFLTYEVHTPPLATQGTFDINSAEKRWTFTPYPDYNGTLTVVVLIDDNHGGTDLVNIDITVNPVNDAPEIPDYAEVTPEDTPFDSFVAGTDVDGDALAYSKKTDPANGTVIVNPDGTYTYTPDEDYNGTDSFTVEISDGNGGIAVSTVTVNVSSVDDPPAIGDYSFTTNEDTPHSASVTATDVDTLPGGLVYSLGDTPSHGTATVNADGSYTYTPDADYNGADSFSITVTDGTGFDEANIDVTVLPINDPPRTRDYVYTIDEEGELSNTILASDPEEDDLTFSVQTPPDAAEGTFSIDSDTGEWDFEATEDFNGGPVTIEVLVSDGNGGTAVSEISITIRPVNDPPEIPDYSELTPEDTVLAASVSATDVDGDALTYGKKTDPVHGTVAVNADGTYTYTPDLNYNGTDVFTIEVSDGNGGRAVSTVVVNISSVDDPPQIGDYNENTLEDTPVSGTVSGTDPDGDELEYRKGSEPLNGSVEVSTGGAWTYTPDENFHGTDSFTIIVDDGADGYAVSTVTISVASVNDPPVVPDYQYRILAGRDHEGTIVASDIETAAENLAYTVNTPPMHGTLMLSPDGTYTYEPDSGYLGSDEFIVTVTDEDGGTAVSTVSYVMYKIDEDPNNPPTAPDYSFSTPQGVPASGQVQGTDPDGDRLSYKMYKGPSHGILSVESDGNWTFTPFDGYTGSDYFTVKVSDGRGGSTISRIDMTIGDVEYRIGLEAVPDSMLGDGQTTTVLYAAVTDSYGNPVSGADVVFTAPVGEFPSGASMVTDSDGKAQVPYGKVDLSGSVEPRTIEVLATVEDTEKGLYATDTILIHFMPAVLRGAVYDTNICGPVNGAEVKISADFDEDGNIDFEGTYITGADGRYEFVVPYGNEIYDVRITFDFEVSAGNVRRTTFYQKGTVDKAISGVGDVFHSERIHYTMLSVGDGNGNNEVLKDFSKISYKLYRYLSGSPIMTVGSISMGKPVNLALLGDGILYAAVDEKLEEVAYPVSAFETDGMLSIEMPDFADTRDYKLVVLNAEGEEIGVENFRMMTDGQFCVGSLLIASSDIGYTFSKKDLAVVLTSDKRKVAENGSIEMTLDYYNRTAEVVGSVELELAIPEGFTVTDADGGTVSEDKIVWDLGTLSPNESGQVKVGLVAGAVDVPEKTVEFIASIDSDESLTNLEDDVSRLTIMVYSTSLEHMHKRYIKGYPDYTFRPENSITRAEVAAIFARILDLENTVTGQEHYRDIESGHWAEEYIEAATKQGLFQGNPDGTFKPESPITRAELAVVVARYFNTERSDSLQPINSFFTDTEEHWAENTIEEIHRIGIAEGYLDGTYKPQSAISRPEAITMVNRMLFRGPLANAEATFPDMPTSHWASGHAEESIRTHTSTFNPDGSETMIEFIPEPLW